MIFTSEPRRENLTEEDPSDFADRRHITDYGDVTERLYKDYFQIWEESPTLKDLNSVKTILRVIPLLILFSFLLIATFLLVDNVLISATISGSFAILFFAAFRDQFFTLNTKKPLFRSVKHISPFKQFHFFMLTEKPDVLFLTNLTDKTTTCVAVLYASVLPENVHANVNRTIRGLNENKRSFSFQIFHDPIIGRDSIGETRQLTDNSMRTKIYYTISLKVTRMLSGKLLKTMSEQIRREVLSLQTSITANYSHHKMDLLEGEELIDAFKSCVLKINDESSIEEDFYLKHSKDYASPFFKAAIMFGIIGYAIWILLLFHLHSLYILIVSIIIFGSLISNWKNLFSTLGFAVIKRYEEFSECFPFKNVKFYKARSISDAIFLYIRNELLLEYKCFNIAYALPSLHPKVSFCFPEKFYRALVFHKIPFHVSFATSPYTFYEFDKECFRFLTETSKKRIINFDNDYEADKWISVRGGAWRVISLYSTYAYLRTNLITPRALRSLDETTEENAFMLRDAFDANYPKFELTKLTNGMLESGLKTELLKTKLFRSLGTHLYYIASQGKTLMKLIEISDILRKGVETRIAAEFNTPLNIDNGILIGKTLNTEFWTEESPIGLKLEQVGNLLITNGTFEQRELIAMKIAEELIKNKIPCIIFDFTGNWSHLLSRFENTPFKQDLLFFKAGKNFGTPLIESDIPYDDNNLHYLEYMYECYRLAYKKNDFAVNQLRSHIRSVFKTLISKDGEESDSETEEPNEPQERPRVSTATARLLFASSADTHRNFGKDNLQSLFDEFEQNDFTMFTSLGFHDKDLISSKNFVEDHKTVVLDLSRTTREQTKAFLSFLILSKIFHYAHYGGKPLVPKVIFVPDIDLFFEKDFLERIARDYGSVNMFLDPLFKNKFGLVAMINQAHNLHANVLTRLENTIALRTTDKRDLSVLINQLSLQELHGTGYYSKSRNNTYQATMLMNLKPSEAIMRRSDLNQPFPIKLDDASNHDLTLRVPTESEINVHMREMGFQLERAEEKMTNLIAPTIIENNLGSHAAYVPELIQFLQALKKVHGVALYEAKIKEQLLQYIYKKGRLLNKTNRELRIIRNEIFQLLTKHNYLVESHHRTAGGSESIRISYKVGREAKRAIQDYNNVKEQKIQSLTIVDTLEKESGNGVFAFPAESPISESHTEEGTTEDMALRQTLTEILNDLFFDLFTIHDHLTIGNLQEALTLAKQFPVALLTRLYGKKTESQLTQDSGFLDYIDHLSKDLEFPFNGTDVKILLDTLDSMVAQNDDAEKIATKAHQTVSDFYDALQNFLN
ncbi:MAG: hypothetical protein GF383_01655 [Candidatus Lokiarchaeota archaeon]|nr:hypothetical protein [Candidatus Lokiarchaeota archaeon]